jgi:hypothetical protein
MGVERKEFDMRKELAIAGFAVLSVVAVAGWVRQPSTAATAMHPVPVVQQAPYAAVPTHAYLPGQGYVPAQAFTPAVVNAPVAQAPARAQAPAPRVQAAPRQTVVSQPAARVVHKEPRSTGKSVAIVAGSAGAGAAIGGIAGGGKGAAIGALSGGTAGFVYDRVTRNPK